MWNTQDLSGVDLVGMTQHRSIRFEDHRVLGSLPIVVLGDLAERISALHCVEPGFRLGIGNRQGKFSR